MLESVRTDMMWRAGSQSAEPITPHEGVDGHRRRCRPTTGAGGAGCGSGWCRRRDAELILAQLNGQLAVLEGARAELEAGWVQGGWWSVSTADGGHRLETGDAGGSPAHVDGSCLVGALARARGSSSDVGRAVDAVYDALWASCGQPSTPAGCRPCPRPRSGGPGCAPSPSGTTGPGGPRKRSWPWSIARSAPRSWT